MHDYPFAFWLRHLSMRKLLLPSALEVLDENYLFKLYTISSLNIAPLLGSLWGENWMQSIRKHVSMFLLVTGYILNIALFWIFSFEGYICSTYIFFLYSLRLQVVYILVKSKSESNSNWGGMLNYKTELIQGKNV